MKKIDEQLLCGSVWRIVPPGDEWTATFRSFSESAFRLETLQTYRSPVETEAIERFRRGEPVSSEWLNDWCKIVSEHRANGRPMSRVHIVELPFSEYVQFEIECAYVHTSRAGEDIHLVDRSTVPLETLSLLSEDFWLFDDSKVMVQDYEPNGDFIRGRVSNDHETVKRYLRARDEALKLAIPFRDFYQSATGRKLD